MWRWTAFGAAILTAGPLWARTATVVKVTSGDHPGFGRVVLDAPGLTHTLVRDGDVLRIVFSDEPALGALPPVPRNVAGFHPIPGGIEVTVKPGGGVRDWETGTKLVLDVEDTPSARPRPAPAKPADAAPPPPPPAARPKPEPPPATIGKPLTEAVPPPAAAPAKAVPPPSAPAAAEATDTARAVVPADPAVAPESVPAADTRDPEKPSAAVAPEEGQAWPVTRGAPPSGPVALVATRSRPPLGLTGSALQIPFADPVGAAMFVRGPDTYAVFDERRPIDLAGVRDDPVFSGAVVSIFPAATVIRLAVPKGQAAVLSRAAAGWRISVVPATPRPAPMAMTADKGAMTFVAEAPGQVVAIADPASGATLLVGTQRKPGQAVLTERRTGEFLLPATSQGIVVEPLSDAIGLRAVQTGFVLSGGPDGLVLSPAPVDAVLDAAKLTRRFEFPGQPTDALTARAHRQATAAAAAPPLARGPKRRALAESLIGLGMGVEARTWLKLAMKEDPAEAASPTTQGLAAIAALIAGYPAEAAPLTDPALTGTDEVALWRALQMAMADEGSPAAAPVLAATAPLLFTYPEELRRRVLPLAMETMVLGGETAAAAKLLTQRENDPTLAYARALLKQAQGDNDAALKALDEVANTRSPYDHARAAVRAVELRLAMGQIDPKTAADSLQRLQYAWRGDARDLAVRRRIAALRQKAGDWRTVFALLRGVKADFPAQAAEIDRQMKEAFAALPADPSIDAMPPADLIALLEENAGLMADGPEGEPMRMRLADKLMALDLTKRADPLLTRLMYAAPAGPSRAGLGATLATLRLREDDPEGALRALTDSKAADLPEQARQRRGLLTARVQMMRGDRAAALEALAGMDGEETDDIRAAILERAQDWEGARDVLTGMVVKTVPPDGPLNEEQTRMVLRLATAAARAGDDMTLASLREKTEGRLGTGPMVDMFRLLTARPVRDVADLARARAEIGLVKALGAAVPATKPVTKTP